jgi:hypothetical protein
LVKYGRPHRRVWIRQHLQLDLLNVQREKRRLGKDRLKAAVYRALAEAYGAKQIPLACARKGPMNKSTCPQVLEVTVGSKVVIKNPENSDHDVLHQHGGLESGTRREEVEKMRIARSSGGG